MDSELSTPSAKHVRWDESLPPDPPQWKKLVSSDAPPPSPSCSANDAIRLSSAAIAVLDSHGEAKGSNPAEEDTHQHINREGFRPEFTHQLFDEERIGGFKDGEVNVKVVYSPTTLDFLVKIQTPNDQSTTGRTSDILSRLAKALPGGNYTTDEDSFQKQLESRRREFTPPGERVHEYHKGGETFSVYRATGEDPGACEYHGRAQCLAPWFIEAADEIDLSDDRWEVFYMFQEETTTEILGEKWKPAALVGYFTVFGFRNPVKGVSLRVCQALVLPQFQRQGHGKTMLEYLYGQARSRESVFEITVEDPAPGFEKVRNLVDARTLRELRVFPADILSSDVFKRPSKDVIQAAHTASKLTVSQVEIAFDILKACDVSEEAGETTDISAVATGSGDTSTAAKVSDEQVTAAGSAASRTDPTIPSAGGTVPSGNDATHGGNAQADGVDDKQKRYRLMVKRRLLKRHGEELSTDATARKRQLEELYRDVEPGLVSLGAKLRKEDRREEETVV